MIIIKISGGLGNQMFQYAFGLALTKYLDTEFKIDVMHYEEKKLRLFELSLFEINFKTAAESEINLYPVYNIPFWSKLRRKILGLIKPRYYFVENGLQYHPEVFKLSKNTYLRGFWQDERYFLSLENEIREKFKFKPSVCRTENKLVSEKIANTNSVSIHIRRSDYANDKSVLALNGILPIGYYYKAIELISGKVDQPHYFIFSDEPDWVLQHFNIQSISTIVSINNGKYSYEDMRLMSLCKHHIIANSSFSWWGAWLNPSKDKIVIAPNQWYADPIVNKQVKQIVPASWIKI